MERCVRLLGQSQHDGGMPRPRRISLATGLQLLQPILADRLQHAEPWLALESRFLPQQVVLDQRFQTAKDVESTVRVGDCLGWLQGHPACKDSQAAE